MLQFAPAGDHASIRESRGYALAKDHAYAEASQEAEALQDGSALGDFSAASVLAHAAYVAKLDDDLPENERTAVVTGYSARALDLLRKAAAAGLFEDAAQLEALQNNEALDALRGLGAFQQFLEQVAQ